ncbi:MAG: NAD(P)H-hydrate dehydratase [Planctomycetes bacterium]|nr:NAD(P)H-hydrate dehydratase [Planctomycetota bacterium]
MVRDRRVDVHEIDSGVGQQIFKVGEAFFDAVTAFGAQVLVIGPGLGQSISSDVVTEFIARFPGPVVVDADGLNAVARATSYDAADPRRVTMTPHVGELKRLLEARGVSCNLDASDESRRAAACALVEAYGCVAVLKGRGTVVTDGDRLYVNETGNSGMASGGMGDVLSGVIAALIGQGMAPLEAAILGVYLHGLAGDFAAEELGRWSITATDLLEYLPEAFCEYDVSESP